MKRSWNRFKLRLIRKINPDFLEYPKIHTSIVTIGICLISYFLIEQGEAILHWLYEKSGKNKLVFRVFSILSLLAELTFRALGIKRRLETLLNGYDYGLIYAPNYQPRVVGNQIIQVNGGRDYQGDLPEGVSLTTLRF